MSHTKGPWRVRGQDILSNGENGYICSWSGKLEDARLIAASPDLLEACKWAFVQLNGQIKGYAVGTDLIHKSDAVAKLEHAIAKAEGK